ncbi:MAG TPA: GntR family transcriptional regulator [Rhodocyclaceae bacterium]|nr:GntR family transcriptional regulator [Rhodocyclaceae bacterium]
MNMPDADGLLLADKAYLKLRELLTREGLRAGQFVSMPDLVRMLGFPLAPTREAVKRAETVALVEVVPKRGVMVMEATPERIRECFDLRAILDQEGARRIVRHHDPSLLDALRAHHERVLAQAREGITPALQHEAKEVDWELHQALAAALENPAAEAVYALNRDKIAVIQHSRPLLPDRIVPAMEEHLRIIDAISDGDEDLAAGAVRDHYRHTLRWWGIFV